MIDFTGSHFEKAISLWGIRWSVASRISDRPWEERMQERGVHAEHVTLTRGGLN